MTEMIERVAQAMYERHCNPEQIADGAWRKLDGFWRTTYFEKARAAIETMRHPTPAMIHAMNEHAGSIAPEYAYQDALTAALSEPK